MDYESLIIESPRGVTLLNRAYSVNHFHCLLSFNIYEFMTSKKYSTAFRIRLKSIWPIGIILMQFESISSKTIPNAILNENSEIKMTEWHTSSTWTHIVLQCDGLNAATSPLLTTFVQ